MRKKYYVSELFSNQRYNAAVGREDIEALLDSLSYKRIDFAEDKFGFVSRIISYVRLLIFLARIKPDDIVFFHFPLYSRVKKMFLLLLKQKGTKRIAYVNDLEGLRDQDNVVLENELALLSKCSGAIVLNEAMQKFVAERCHHLPTSPMIIWDYLMPSVPQTDRVKSLDVMFAGNQGKAPFLKNLGDIKDITFHLYGKNELETYPTNCRLYGGVDAKVLPAVCKGSFGLVWDGSSVETCEGGTGEYLRINSPYKLSLYLMAGLPVLIWQEAALATWVTENNLGIKVDSLHSLHKIIDSVSEEEYRQMQENIKAIQPVIATGVFFKSALANVVQ